MHLQDGSGTNRRGKTKQGKNEKGIRSDAARVDDEATTATDAK